MAELSPDSMSWMIFRWHLQVRDRWLTYPLGVPTLGPCRYVGSAESETVFLGFAPWMGGLVSLVL
jgi:hypothetical protein